MVIEINPLTPAISVKVISFFEISFVTRKIVSGTTRFCSPPLPHLFCPRNDQIPSPFPSSPLHVSRVRTVFFFFSVSISEFTNYSQTCLRWHRIEHSHCIRRHIPVGDCLIQGWLNWANKFCPHFGKISAYLLVIHWKIKPHIWMYNDVWGCAEILPSLPPSNPDYIHYCPHLP